MLLSACIESPQGRTPERRSTQLSGAGESYWEVQLLVRIGSVNGPHDALGRVGEVLITPDTTLVISQPGDASLLVYDQHGRRLRQVGRRGQGPGEFGSIRGMGLLGDTLYVSDPAQLRVNYFDLEGGVIYSRRWATGLLRLSEDYFFAPTPPQVLLGDGTAMVQPSMGLTPTSSMKPGLNTALYRTPYLHIDGASRIMDTVAWRDQEGASVGVTKGGETYVYASPFSHSPLVRIMPDGTGVVLVERAQGGAPTFRVVRIRPEGDTAFTRTFAYAPVPTPEHYLERTFRRRAASGDRGDGAPTADEIRRAFGDVGLIPEHLVPVTGLAIGRDGSIWLRREDDLQGAMVEWNVLESDQGRLEGSVRLPASDAVSDAYGDFIATARSGDFDVPQVSLWRLRR